MKNIGWILCLFLFCSVLRGQKDLTVELNNDYKVKFVQDGDWDIDVEYSYLEFYKSNELYYRSTNSDVFCRGEDNINYIQQSGVDYFFFRYSSPPDPDLHLIVIVNHQEIKDTILTYGKGVVFQDVDNDGFIEFGGLPTSWSGYCVGCDSVFYISYHVYEINNGIRFDSIVSKELNNARYMQHIDFSRGRHVVRRKE